MLRRVSLSFLVFLWAAAATPSRARAADAGAGVVVEAVGKTSSSEKAGLAAGDVLVGWERAAEGAVAVHGELRMPSDLWGVEVEQAARGGLTLIGRRGREPMRFLMAERDWQLTVRPLLGAEDEALYTRGRDASTAGDAAEARRLWRELASAARRRDDPRTACWALIKIGQSQAEVKAFDEAQRAYDEALAVARERLDRIAVLRARADAFNRAPAYVEAAGAYLSALEIERGAAAQSLVGAFLLNDLGRIAWNRTDLDEAERFFAESLAIREALAPDSWVVAISLNNIANVLGERGDNAGAQARYERTLAIRERIAPGSALVADALNNLAIEARIRGDLAQAEQLLLRAVAIRERLLAAGADVSSQAVGETLHSLGHVALDRRDLERAQQLFERALVELEKAGAHGRSISIVLNGLASVLLHRGDLEGADRAYRRVLALAETVGSDSLVAAWAMSNRARVALERGDLDEAERLARESLRIQEARAPGHFNISLAAATLGQVLARRGRLDEADAVFERVLQIRRQLAPGSAGEADALGHLALLARTRNDLVRAADFYREALDILDRQSSRVGGGQEAQVAFGSRGESLYREVVAFFADQGRAAEAFHVLERSRARTFLALLGERDLIHADVPPELRQRRRQVDTRYDRAQARLARLEPTRDAEEVRRLTGELRDLRVQQAALQAELLQAAPRVAALHSAHALDFAETQAALDDGTVLVAYSVGDERTDAFVIARTGDIERYAVPLGRKALEERVRRLRGWLSPRPPENERSFRDEAVALYDALLRPAEARLSAAERIVLCPDGPLHILPFAALRRDNRYLVEWKPLHSVVSATVYAQLRAGAARGSDHGAVVTFGDPHYGSVSEADADGVRDAAVSDGLRRGLRLGPLPASRREVEAIAALYGERARTYVGEAATEERAKSESREARYLHFACHALLDESFPLNSGLALTLRDAPGEGQDNGLLQAWEVFERVRVDADLVTLSACNTGLGKDVGGEGLLGLTRAFQYAGARSVVASLWAVPDRSTAELMRAFYAHLKRGSSKDAALRAAQLERLGKGGAAAHPFRWAAFQVFGDWR